MALGAIHNPGGRGRMLISQGIGESLTRTCRACPRVGMPRTSQDSITTVSLLKVMLRGRVLLRLGAATLAPRIMVS